MRLRSQTDYWHEYCELLDLWHHLPCLGQLHLEVPSHLQLGQSSFLAYCCCWHCSLNVFPSFSTFSTFFQRFANPMVAHSQLQYKIVLHLMHQGKLRIKGRLKTSLKVAISYYCWVLVYYSHLVKSFYPSSPIFISSKCRNPSSSFSSLFHPLWPWS
jgi:hypothetical protein